MKMPRKSLSLTPRMNKKLEEFSKLWRVSEGEVARRIFGIGVLIFELVNEGNNIYAEKEDGERVRLIFPKE